MKGRVLIIAGSDSSGGAGIQADIKTVTALNGYAATAVTALTAQNTTGVYGIHEVPIDFISEQIRLVVTDIGVDCIKTGMLHSPEVINAVVGALTELAPDVPVVVDPVIVAKGGASLLQDHAIATLRDALVPLATVITPNTHEAEALTGLSIRSLDDMRVAGQALMERGAGAVLVKGGHMPGDDLTDLLVTADGENAFGGRRIDTVHTHGTGCTTASAVATGIAQGLSLRDAVARAHDYVRKAIETAPEFGSGHGPLNHAHTVQQR